MTSECFYFTFVKLITTKVLQMSSENNKKNMIDHPDDELNSSELAKKILPDVQHGDYSRIAQETGLTKQTVWNHLNGMVKYPNLLILRAAINIIKRRKRRVQKLAEAI